MRSLQQLAIVIAIAATSLLAHAETPAEINQRAAAAVVKIQGQMLDPGSFALDDVWTSREHKRDDANILCFTFRSHNHMGGFSEGKAYLRGLGLMEIFSAEEPGWSWLRLCKGKENDITVEVKTLLNPPAPAPAEATTTVTPAEAAAQAQAYADCMKLAVSNTQIVCKAPRLSKSDAGAGTAAPAKETK